MARRLTRRELLTMLGGASVGLAGFACGWPRPASWDRAGQGAFVPASQGASPAAGAEIVLTAREIQWELAPGKLVAAWAYNGQVPGPEIRVRAGERVRIVLANELAEPTTIHWHGIDVPAAMDGVPDLSQAPVRPGERFVYEFLAEPAGTRWYHTHANSAKQLAQGLFAPFVIEPAAGTSPDREYTLVLSDWATGGRAPEPRQNRSTGRGGMMGGMMNGMMGGHRPSFDTFTINGKAFPATRLLSVRRGERVRLHLINAGSELTHYLRLAGHRLQVTHTDGNPLAAPVEVDVVPIAPSERYDVEFQADQPGRWPLYCVEPGHAAGGLKTLVVYEGYEDQPE
ncbi:MAG: multicopper oxidase domain-containing protein [Chloroflexi bacterium]|nr:multicopper oxidase domain-containing protein [Chloroflexota bacterium]